MSQPIMVPSLAPEIHKLMTFLAGPPGGPHGDQITEAVALMYMHGLPAPASSIDVPTRRPSSFQLPDLATYEQDVPPLMFNSHVWFVSPLLVALGVPIKFTGTLTNKSDFEGGPWIFPFVFDFDPEDPTRNTHHAPKTVAGMTIFARIDGQVLDPYHFGALADCVQRVMRQLISTAAHKTDTEGLEPRLLELITPYTFKSSAETFFAREAEKSSTETTAENLRAARKLVGEGPYGGQLKYCWKCGMMERAGGPQRLKCGEFKKRYYCDATCQKVNWKVHKHVCQKVIEVSKEVS